MMLFNPIISIASENSWWHSAQVLADAVPHPIMVGCITIALGALAFALASPLKSSLDRACRSKNAGTRAKGPKLRIFYWSTLLAGLVLTAAGTGLTINGGQLNAQGLLDETLRANEIARKEYEAKLGAVLTALNAAKHEQTRLLTEEKIKGLQKDLVSWVNDFAIRKPNILRQFEEAKLANTQKEIQLSQDTAPVFSFIMRVLEESLRVYSERNGSKIQVNLPPLPQNHFTSGLNRPNRSIVFPGNAVWTIHITASPPANENNAIVFQIYFRGVDNKPRGSVRIYERGRKKIFVEADGVLPTPDDSLVSGIYDLDGYEETLGKLLQRLVEAQLIQTP